MSLSSSSESSKRNMDTIPSGSTKGDNRLTGVCAWAGRTGTGPDLVSMRGEEREREGADLVLDLVPDSGHDNCGPSIFFFVRSEGSEGGEPLGREAAASSSRSSPVPLVLALVLSSFIVVLLFFFFPLCNLLSRREVAVPLFPD